MGDAWIVTVTGILIMLLIGFNQALMGMDACLRTHAANDKDVLLHISSWII